MSFKRSAKISMRSMSQIIGRLSAANSPLSIGARNGILTQVSSPFTMLPFVQCWFLVRVVSPLGGMQMQTWMQIGCLMIGIGILTYTRMHMGICTRAQVPRHFHTHIHVQCDCTIVYLKILTHVMRIPPNTRVRVPSRLHQNTKCRLPTPSLRLLRETDTTRQIPWTRSPLHRSLGRKRHGQWKIRL